MKEQIYKTPEAYTAPYLPKFKEGDYVVTNDYHWEQARILFERNAKFIKTPVKIVKIYITDNVDYPIHYDLLNGEQMNEIFLKEIT